ncbi:glycosyltransferase [Pseudotabrizicola sp.]|uniref:glycosyltransferase n=1 Tax=Pseudotabrizicola sp. TaxID=2939647 RepID=UPI0027164C0D|nr:glycosyltransferase [Pseudotabrizicola sp.]MDO8882903.1 glycosyltransferase [Pseudotabrizicola sp.]
MSVANAMSTQKAPALLTRRRMIAMIGDLNLQQCKKYRIEQLTELWGTVGVDYQYAHFEDIPRCIAIMQAATHLMLYRLQRHDIVTSYLYEARRLRLPVLYDIDDPLFSVEAYATYGNMAVLPTEVKQHFLAQAPLYLDILNAADILSFSTPGLRDHAMSLSPRPAFVRRNFADRETLEAGRTALQSSFAEKSAADGFTLCFASGSQGHEADFQTIAPQVEAFLGAAPNRKLLILGHFQSELLSEKLQSQIETRPFSDYATYLGHLARADVAVMPLADDLFNRCKSAVRVIDAAAAGVPSIVSATGDLAAMINPGKTGYIAATPDDWTGALETLATDKAVTAQMGRNARLVLEDLWSARASQPIIDTELVGWVKE